MGIYQGDCICRDEYIGKIEELNIMIRWDEHNNPKHDSERA